jgi:DNA-binding NarL/FixJ family response regulator
MHSILAVDDSISMRQMVSFTLKNAGYEVVEAVDGEDAFEKARQRSFDLVQRSAVAEANVRVKRAASPTSLQTANGLVDAHFVAPIDVPEIGERVEGGFNGDATAIAPSRP